VLENFDLLFGSMLKKLFSIYLSDDNATIVVMSKFVLFGFNKKRSMSLFQLRSTKKYNCGWL